ATGPSRCAVSARRGAIAERFWPVQQARADAALVEKARRFARLSPARVATAVAVIVAAALIARVMVAVIAIDSARHRIAGKSAEHRAADDTGKAAMTDGATDRAAADRAENGARRVMVPTAGVGERARGSRAEGERRRGEEACGLGKHGPTPCEFSGRPVRGTGMKRSGAEMVPAGSAGVQMIPPE